MSQNEASNIVWVSLQYLRYADMQDVDGYNIYFTISLK